LGSGKKGEFLYIQLFTVENESDRISTYPITDKYRDQRIDTFLASRVKELTRSRVQELIKKGFVKVNDHSPKTSYRLKTGDYVSLFIPAATPYQLEPEQVEFSLIHEDSSIIILNKPSGLVIHPAPGHRKGTLVHGLLQQGRDLSGIGGVLRPGIVHRLDKDTSGLMVVAKNDQVHISLSRQFKSGTVRKRYLALVHGIPRGESGEINLPIARHPKRRKEMAVLLSRGKTSLTLWQKMEELGNRFSLLSVSPKTGRTHQIRVHFSHLGHPIVGDPIYGYKKNWWKKNFPLATDIVPQIKRQMLHAEGLGFIHPDSKQYCEFHAPMPDDMDHIINKIKSYYK
jgi:23S rRNA pseudouridine1911/1915/1917 synthase